MDLSTIDTVLQWTKIWLGLFFCSRAASSVLSKTYRELDEPQKGYWSASLVSNLHACYVFMLAAKALRETPSFLTTTNFHLSTPASLECSMCLLGYMASDLLFVLWYNKKWSGMVATLTHHIFVLICWSLFITGKNGQIFALVCALCEASTPFVNCRWFLDKFSMKNSPLYVANGLAMFFSFFACRVVGFLWMGTRLFAQREGFAALPIHISILFLLSFGVGTMLQLFWFSKIAKGMMKALGYGGKPVKKVS
mmetsp:Transcript_1211/g.1891  ORF Transcript_1211/g.1891 Transcript_1211/m.1891 type:complete len:252 (+) Transcript_1211:74-829(+)